MLLKIPMRDGSAVAILTDRDRGFRPAPYREGGEAEDDHRLCYHYKTFKVLDQCEEDLEQSDNPFALVILTTRAALKRENGEYTEEEYFQRKLELAHWLKDKSTSEAQMQALLSFLKYYLPLEDQALEDKFNEQLKERNETMGTVEYLVNEAKENGRCEGREEEKSSFVRSLLENTDFDDGKIATLAAVEEDFVRRSRCGEDLSARSLRRE